MKSIMFAISGLVLVGGVAQAKDRLIENCYLQVDGKAYLDQPCIFAAQKDGSFTVGTSTENGNSGRMPFFAYVNMNDDGTATGYWNEDASNSHAQTDLGKLKRNGACWQNSRAKICAR